MKNCKEKTHTARASWVAEARGVVGEFSRSAEARGVVGGRRREEVLRRG